MIGTALKAYIVLYVNISFRNVFCGFLFISFFFRLIILLAVE